MLISIVVRFVIAVMVLFFLALCVFSAWWWHKCVGLAKHDVTVLFDYPDGLLTPAGLRLETLARARKYYWGLFLAVPVIIMQASLETIEEESRLAYEAELKRTGETNGHH